MEPSVFSRSALNSLKSPRIFKDTSLELSLSPTGAKFSKAASPAPGVAMRDADFWRRVIAETQRAKTKQNRNKLEKSITEGEAKKKSALDAIHMSASSQVRAAGLLSDKKADQFERKLTQQLQNVKGIDLDGDGQIDEEELDYAKEMEARLIRSRAFCEKVKSYGIPWKWFGGGLHALSEDKRVDAIFRNPHFDVNLDMLTTKFRNYLLTQSPSVSNCISPRPDAMLSSKQRRKEHEEAMWNAPKEAMQERIRAVAVDPLTAQPDSYRKYLTEINPITGKFIWE